MFNYFKTRRPILWGVLAGTILGVMHGIDFLQANAPAFKGPLAMVLPFGILAPPFLVVVQLPMLRQGRPRWYHWINARVNMALLMSLWALVLSLTYVIGVGSFDPESWGVDIAFFASGGIGFFLAALIDLRWGQPPPAVPVETQPKQASGPWG